MPEVERKLRWFVEGLDANGGTRTWGECAFDPWSMAASAIAEKDICAVRITDRQKSSIDYGCVEAREASLIKKVETEVEFGYSLCEPVSASSLSPWHIRSLTKTGKHFGGGADTPALCGRTVSWDLETDVDRHIGTERICPRCRDLYVARDKGSSETTSDSKSKGAE